MRAPSSVKLPSKSRVHRSFPLSRHPIDTQPSIDASSTQPVTVCGICFEPEDSSFACGCLHEGPLACRLGLIGQPRLAETSALARALLVAEETGTRLHISQVSCARSVELIEEAKNAGSTFPPTWPFTAWCSQSRDIQDFDGLPHEATP